MSPGPLPPSWLPDPGGPAVDQREREYGHPDAPTRVETAFYLTVVAVFGVGALVALGGLLVGAVWVCRALHGWLG